MFNCFAFMPDSTSLFSTLLQLLFMQINKYSVKNKMYYMHAQVTVKLYISIQTILA